MRRRLSLESLESRLAPAALGTLMIDPQSLTFTIVPAAVASPNGTTTIVLPPASANSPPSSTAIVGSFTSGNLSDSFSIPNAVQGSTLNLAFGGNGNLSIKVYDQYGDLLGQRYGSLAISLNLTNLIATNGVTVVVTSDTPTNYQLTTLLAGPSSTGTPSTPPNSFVSDPTLSGGLGPQLIGNYPTNTPGLPVDPKSYPGWVLINGTYLYNPPGTPDEPWSPPAGFHSPSGLPFNPPPITPPLVTPPTSP